MEYISFYEAKDQDVFPEPFYVCDKLHVFIYMSCHAATVRGECKARRVKGAFILCMIYRLNLPKTTTYIMHRRYTHHIY